MKMIPLTNSDLASIVDDEDYDRVISENRKWSITSNGYVQGAKTVNGALSVVLLHRILMKGIPAIDHANHDKLDNRRSNLRAATPSQNTANSLPRTNKLYSRFKGVCWHKAARKWMASIGFKYRLIYLGLWEREEDAARAYDRAARLYFGEFALTNFE